MMWWRPTIIGSQIPESFEDTMACVGLAATLLFALPPPLRRYLHTRYLIHQRSHVRVNANAMAPVIAIWFCFRMYERCNN
jgi:hypothetical protein